MPNASRTFNNSQLTINKRKGFTLIELLITIAIAGILATFVVSSFGSAQQKGRDARRKSDLDAVKKALELAKSDCTGSNYYPVVTGTPTNNENTRFDALQTHLANTNLKYMNSVPDDPKNSGSYMYGYNTNATTTSSVCADTDGDATPLEQTGSTDYMLRALLERGTNDPDSASTFTKCSGKPGVPGVNPGNTYYVCND